MSEKARGIIDAARRAASHAESAGRAEGHAVGFSAGYDNGYAAGAAAQRAKDAAIAKSIAGAIAAAIEADGTGAGWSGERPTVPGWYWMRYRPDAPQNVCHVRRAGDGLVYWNGAREVSIFESPAEWSGPIPPPAKGADDA